MRHLNILLNGKITDLPTGITIAQLVQDKGLNPATIIIEYNQELVTQELWTQTTLREDDQLEILKFVGGG